MPGTVHRQGTMTEATLSRREFLQLGGLGLAAAMLGACGPSPPPPPTPKPTPLAVKIGQMIVVGFQGLTVDDDHPIVQDIRQRHIGGVVLFDYDAPSGSSVRNIESPKQVKALVAALQRAAPRPLLVAIDQEGGKICRLKERFGFPATVSHQFLGTKDDLALTREHAGSIAHTLRLLGINLNLAPVVDLNLNPDNPIIGKLERSFSADPAIVIRHARAFIRAHHDRGVRCALKHFPGHGSSTGDSHHGLTDVSDTWQRIELEPYRALIEAGLADAIMTAHVFNANLDPKHPATLSQATIDTLLRQELGYDGVAISDALEMGAISKHYGFESAVEMAVQAGVDVLVFANNTRDGPDIYAATRAITQIQQLVEEGKVETERIDRSYRRIQRLKKRLLPT